MGKKVNRTNTWICQIETGKRIPPRTKRLELAWVLGIAPEDLFPEFEKRRRVDREQDRDVVRVRQVYRASCPF